MKTENTLGTKSGDLSIDHGEEGAESEDGVLSEETLPGQMMKGANISRKRSVLGRGLSALMTSSAVSVGLPGQLESQDRPWSLDSSMPKSTTSNARRDLRIANPRAGEFMDENPVEESPIEGGLIYLSLDRVFPNKSQPRTSFPAEEIEQLTRSIKESGMLQPIIVRRRSAAEAGPLASYEIVAGERRWRAAKQAGLLKIPALLKSLTDKEALELAIIENVQRADLNPIEAALAYERLIEEFGSTQAEVAETMGKDRASVANALRLLKLPEQVRNWLIAGIISAGHGRALLMLASEEQQLSLGKRIIEEGLSVRAVEDIAAEMVHARSIGGNDSSAASDSAETPTKIESKSPSVVALEDRLRQALGTKIRLMMRRNGKGELRISFFSQAELENLLEKLGA